jgi:hypothetical protein
MGFSVVARGDGDGLYIQGLSQMSRELPVAVGRADGETAAMGIDNYAGAIRTNGERPDSFNTAEAITLVADILWLQRRLAPFIDHTTQGRNQQVRIGNNAVGPILIECTQNIGLLTRCHGFPPLKDSGLAACAGEISHEDAATDEPFLVALSREASCRQKFLLAVPLQGHHRAS